MTKTINVDGIDMHVNEVKCIGLGDYQIKCSAISQKDKLLLKSLEYIDQYGISLNGEQRELLYEIKNIRKSLLPKKR